MRGIYIGTTRDCVHERLPKLPDMPSPQATLPRQGNPELGSCLDENGPHRLTGRDIISFSCASFGQESRLQALVHSAAFSPSRYQIRPSEKTLQ